MRTENLFISVLEASKATGFPIRKWIQWILRGLIPSEPKLNADHLKGIPYASIAPNIMIPVVALPKDYRTDYLKNVLLLDRLFSVDFIGFLELNGYDAYHRLLKEISVIKEFITIQQGPCSEKPNCSVLSPLKTATVWPRYIARRICSCNRI